MSTHTHFARVTDNMHGTIGVYITWRTSYIYCINNNMTIVHYVKKEPCTCTGREPKDASANGLNIFAATVINVPLGRTER